MKKIFQTLLTPVIFKEINGRFLKIQIQYLAWSVACFFLAMYSGNTVTNGFPSGLGEWLKVTPYFLPYFFMVFLVIRAGFQPSFFQLSDLPNEWKITKLTLAQQWWFKMSEKDIADREALEEWFYNKYGVEFHNMKAHWLYIIHIVILLGLSFLGFYLGK